MFRSLKLGTAFGIDLFVHWTFFLLPAWVLFANLEVGGPALALFALAMVLAVFGCVLLHELGHAMTARRFGIRTRNITLYPIGGVARLEGGPGGGISDKPLEEFWIAVAGPAVNVAIAGLLWLFLRLTPVIAQFVALPAIGLAFLFYLMWANLVLAIFNLLPAFPMDGGRVLRSLLSLRLGLLPATRVAVQVGLVLAMLMALTGLGLFNPLLARIGLAGFGGPMLVLVAIFVYFAGQQELAGVYQREMFRWQQAHAEPYPQDNEPFSAGPAASGSREVSVYLWDSKAGAWVKQKPLRPIRP